MKILKAVFSNIHVKKKLYKNFKTFNHRPLVSKINVTDKGYCFRVRVSMSCPPWLHAWLGMTVM